MSGIRHEPLPSMSRLADDAALALLLSEFVRDRSVPYALFGFSFGAILAYEVCHRLVRVRSEPAQGRFRMTEQGLSRLALTCSARAACAVAVRQGVPRRAVARETGAALRVC
eukprot:scaffold1466_cov385-Prasinococcus_capsulatus_cf.AAC.17